MICNFKIYFRNVFIMVFTFDIVDIVVVFVCGWLLISAMVLVFEMVLSEAVIGSVSPSRQTAGTLSLSARSLASDEWRWIKVMQIDCLFFIKSTTSACALFEIATPSI